MPTLFKRLALVALLAGSIVLSPSALAANTYTVTNTLDSGPGSLREAVTNANSDGVDSVIVFASSANGTIVLTTGVSPGSALRLTNDGMLTITGNGASNTVLSANSALRHMEIAASARVVLNNLTLKDGQQGGGGAIYNDGNLTVNGSTLRDNTSPGSTNGGAIVNAGSNSSLNVSGSLFSNNHAYGGGAIYGGGISLNVVNSNFENNSAVFGGAIVLGNGTGEILASRFTGNTVSISGGAIHSSAAMQIVNSLLISNTTAAGNGGAVYTGASGDTTIVNSTLSNNIAIFGGGFFNEGLLRIRNSIVANNTGNVPGNADCFRNSGTIHAQFSLIGVGLGCVNGTNTGNLSGAPGLDAAYMPTSVSQVINGGDNSLIPVGTSTDLAGAARIQQGTVDMGAFESPLLPSYAVTGTATPAAGGTVSCTPNPVTQGNNANCTQTPNAGYTFSGWSGDCTGTGACNLTNATSAKAVTANYSAITYTITSTASPAASGSVTCTPNPVSHGGNASCTRATNAGYTFSGWSGDCTGTGACTLTNVTSAKAVTANYSAITYIITSAASPAAGGSVTCTPNPVSQGGGASCTRTPNVGYTFTSWSGACSGTGSTCTLTNVVSALAVTAQFVPQVNAPTPITPTVPVVVAPPAEDPGPIATLIDTSGTTTITNPALPVVVGPGAGGGTIVLPQTGTTPVTLQVTINGQPLAVQALPGTQLRIAQVDGQNVLVLVVLQGWASMTSSSVGQPMVLAGPVLLRAGHAVTRVEAIPLAVAVQVGSLLPPQGPDTAIRAAGTSLPQVGRMGLQAGERLLVNDQGAVIAITLGSLTGDTNQPGDPVVFANLPASITVDKAFARLAGPLARLSGASMAQGLDASPSGVFLVRDGGQIFQLLPTLPITIDATLPDGLTFTPLGLLRWVRGGVVVQFAPAVADLAGFASAVTALLPDAQIKLGAEGVLQLRTGGQTYVLKPDWTGGGTATGTPQIGVDSEGRIYLQIGQSARQLLLPALLSASQTSSIVTTALPGAVLAVQAGSTGAFTLTQAGQAWRLMPQWVLPTGSEAQVPPQAGPWWVGAHGLLYLKLGTQVQAVHITD